MHSQSSEQAPINANPFLPAFLVCPAVCFVQYFHGAIIKPKRYVKKTIQLPLDVNFEQPVSREKQWKQL